MKLPESKYCSSPDCHRQEVFGDILDSSEYSEQDLMNAMLLACNRIRYKNPKLPCTLGYTPEQRAELLILQIKQRTSSQTD